MPATKSSKVVLILSLIIQLPISAETINHYAKDGVLHLYGPGGPDSALKRAAVEFERNTGIKVEVNSGPELSWCENAKKNADIIFSGAAQSMSAFLESYPFLDKESVHYYYLRRSVIAVQKGNPAKINGIKDLLQRNLKVVVTEGLGSYNTSGTGLWEDIAGRQGKLSDVQNFSKNIIATEQGSGASFRAFMNTNADAWITWVHWPLTHSDKADFIEIEPEYRIYRPLVIAQAKDADLGTQAFINFINSQKGERFFTQDGWTR